MGFEDRLHASLRLYLQAPEWVRAVGGRVYRALPSRLRHGAKHGAFLAEAQSQTASPWHTCCAHWEDVEHRLAATLAAAAATPAMAPFAAMLVDRRRGALDRLRALPLVSKADIKRDLNAHVNSGVRAGDRLPTCTGGSTAEPMAFFLHRHVTRSKESAYFQHIESAWLDASPRDWSLALRGRTVESAGSGGRLWTTEPIKRHLVFSSDHLEPRFMPDYMTALARLQPRQVRAFPSALYPLARWLEQHPMPQWTERVTGVLLTSENVYDFQLALIRQVFPRARVVVHYGHSERVLMALGLPRMQGASFLPLYGLPELVDAGGAAIDRPGVLGEIVGTSFDNHVMPFVRYRTGDMGVWSEAPRFDGVTRFMMERIEGRSQEFVVCADRRLVSITTLGAAHFHELSRVDRIQFEQRVPGRVTLKVVCSSPLTTDDQVRIARAVREKTQGGCEVDVQEVATIERSPRGKHRMLVQHLDLADFLGAAVPRTAEDRQRGELTQGIWHDREAANEARHVPDEASTA